MTRAVRRSGDACNADGWIRKRIHRIRKILMGMACIEIPSLFKKSMFLILQALLNGN
jgi:hypothetical protein